MWVYVFVHMNLCIDMHNVNIYTHTVYPCIMYGFVKFTKILRKKKSVFLYMPYQVLLLKLTCYNNDYITGTLTLAEMCTLFRYT